MARRTEWDPHEGRPEGVSRQDVGPARDKSSPPDVLSSSKINIPFQLSCWNKGSIRVKKSTGCQMQGHSVFQPEL